VTIHKNELPANDYSSILVAFDDENGIGVHTKTIEGHQLESFMNGTPIHYEEFFPYFDKDPKRMVAWAYSKERGWAERIEHTI
jgi:hypothetical protein